MTHSSSRPWRRTSCVTRAAACCAVALLKSALVTQAEAQTPTDPVSRPAIVDDSLATSAHQAGDSAEPPADLGKTGDRIFGVLPNYSTVEGATRVEPLPVKTMFRIAALNSFDPYIFPFVAVVAGMSRPSGTSYGRGYGTALADNSIGNFMTSAVFPAVLRQDPRYFARGHGGAWHRAAYALTRSVVTHSRSGEAQFNVSEIGGNALAAGLSNLYYAPDARTLSGTAGRFGMQVMWDTMSNELKEFWPDIREMIHAHRGSRQIAKTSGVHDTSNRDTEEPQ